MNDRLNQWRAPAHWQAVDFIADLHLHAADPATFAAFCRYLDTPADQRGDALFILGDLFEVWVGDDALTAPPEGERAFLQDCAHRLSAFAAHTPVFFMAGNRDFLLGTAGLEACGMTGLADPTRLEWAGQPWLLSHGDALCIDDHDYQRFRAEVRSARWQTAFLARPLADREAFARDLRARSEARKREHGLDAALWADVDGATAREWLAAAGSRHLIHGHTHRPARHDLGGGCERWVLSDWDAGAHTPRAEVLRLRADSVQRLSLFPDGG